jgi:hypothetical protein
MARTRNALIAAMALLATPAFADDPEKPFGQDFGLASPLLATGSNLVVTYYGSEATTVFGHTLWAFTASQFQANLTNECYWWNAGAACGGVSGYALGTKAYGDASAGLLDTPLVNAPITWTPGTEVIFALMVNQNDGFNWFFSGDPTRHTPAYSWPSSEPLAHLAYFGTGGVPGNLGVGTIPGTEGQFLFGFEDVRYTPSDWDFNNAIFAVEFGGIDPPAEVVPEPATMTLLASGLLGLAAAQRRRRRSPEA